MKDREITQDEEGYLGHWFSTENGAHFFCREGESEKQAVERGSKEVQEKKRREAESIYDSDGRSEELKEFLGEEFRGYRGREAIKKLLEEEHGYIEGAFSNEELGRISAAWGDENSGLLHIILHREERGQDATALLWEIGNVIRKGTIKKDNYGKLIKNENGRYEITYKGKTAVISTVWHDQHIMYLFTAYYTK